MFRINKTARTLAVVVGVASLSLTACKTTTDSATGGSDCSGATLAFLGPTTGQYGSLGINTLDGAKLALDEYNKTNPKTKVTITPYDSQGDPDKAKPLAQQIVKDKCVIGLIGPEFSGESDSTGQTFADGGLVEVSGSATNPDLTKNGWKTFHRIIGTDAVQAPKAASYIKDTLHAKKVFILDDSSEYGKGLADGVKSALGSLVVGNDEGQQKQTDWSASVTQATSSGADVIFYGGYYPEAGLIVKQLKDGGFKGTFVSGDGTLDPGFIKAGGEAANGAVITCPCLWATGAWAKKYSDFNGQAPGTYSPEGYDVANVFLQGIAAGNTTRDAMLSWVDKYDADGLTKHIQFTSTGDITSQVVYAYDIKNGQIQPGVEIK